MSCLYAETEPCEPSTPVCYTIDKSDCSHCLGPENTISNAPVHPYTCDGDFFIKAAALYWKPSISGLEFGVLNGVGFLSNNSGLQTRNNNNLIDADYLKPVLDFDTGYRVGVGYRSSCDGWSISVGYTHFATSKHQLFESSTKNIPFFTNANEAFTAIVPFWSGFQGFRDSGYPHLRRSVTTDLSTKIDLLSIQLERCYWVSNRLSLEPMIGLAYDEIEFSFNQLGTGNNLEAVSIQPFFADYIDLSNKYEGLGVDIGFSSYFHIGCGFEIFAKASSAILLGTFYTRNNEFLRSTTAPFSKIPVLEVKDNFRASRTQLELQLGLEYKTHFYSDAYLLNVSLCWDSLLFLHQNQLFRVNRTDWENTFVYPNNLGQNVHMQSRGNLSTQGLTLSFELNF